MKLNKKSLLILLSLLTTNVSATGFVGKLVLEPRNKPYYEVMEDFSFIDSDGYKWTTRKGYKTDGASIPPLLWPVIGDPYGGGYIKSAVIHDQACEDKKRSWKDTHRAFFNAMIEEQVNPTKAYIMYAAVYRFGPKWEFKKQTVRKAMKPKFTMENRACFNCKPVDSVVLNETETLSEILPIAVDIPVSELTQDKLDLISEKVKMLEAKGPVTVNDLENINIDFDPSTFKWNE